MSELATLARPYAVAVYKRAKETDSTGKWSETLAFLAALLQDERIARAAANPRTSKAEFAKAFLGLCQGHLDGEGENYVRLLVENRRLGLVASISEQFERYRAEEEGFVAVEVRTAYRLEDDEIEKISQVLRKATGREPRLNIWIDEDLIGGVLIKAGDRVIDATVRGQIQRLAQRLYN
jgi:F-type H+-transporting ATPase subunit delta